MAKKRLEREYLELIMWTALPQTTRTPSTQEELAKKLGVNEVTLSVWKRRPDFWDQVRAFIKEWAKDSTAEIIQAIKKGALMVGEKGQAANARLWLQYVEDWAEKKDISLYDAEKEQRAKSLVDVYNLFDDNKPANSKTTIRKTRSNSRSNKRSTGAKVVKSTDKGSKKKRSNQVAHRRILQKQRRKAV